MKQAKKRRAQIPEATWRKEILAILQKKKKWVLERDIVRKICTRFGSKNPQMYTSFFQTTPGFRAIRKLVIASTVNMREDGKHAFFRLK